MHAIVLMIAIFFNPTPDGKQPPVVLRTIEAPDAQTCLIGGAVLKEQLLQNHAVHDVQIACFHVDSQAPSDKAA